MSTDRHPFSLPPIGRRPVGNVEHVPRPTTTPPTAVPPTFVATGPTRLLIGAHLLLLIQSGLILLSDIDLGPVRAGITAVSAVSAVAFVWAAIASVRQPSRPIRRHRHDA